MDACRKGIPMPYHPSVFCDRRRQVIAFFVSIGLAVSSLVVPWSDSTASASTPMISTYTGTGISGPSEITAGPDGALWFTNPGNNTIGRITTAGAVTNYNTKGSGPGTGISEPSGIAAGPASGHDVGRELAFVEVRRVVEP